jgi:hypothetical protein
MAGADGRRFRPSNVCRAMKFVDRKHVLVLAHASIEKPVRQA